VQQTVTKIHGERVLLRLPQDGDAEESARVWTPELRHMYGGSLTAPGAPTVESRRARFERALRGEEGRFFCVEAGGRYIGFATIDITNEESKRGRYRIGIENPEYWGRGCGTEVTRLMLGYAFEVLGLHRVDLRVAAYNERAIRCYEKSGFHLEGIERDSFFVDGQWHDDLLMAALREEWERESAACDWANEVSIRSYRAADYPLVKALWEAAEVSLGPSDTADVLARKLCLDRVRFLVAEADGKLVGTAMGNVERASGWVRRVAVHPDYRRRGIGRRLVGAIEQALVVLGARRLNLLTHEENGAAIALYEGLGYRSYPQILFMSKDVEPGKERCCGG